MPVYRWDSDKEQIIDRLRSNATLKLCIKLLDEPLLIEGWIQHHAKIVGFENLIIADNGSTDALTLDVYDRYSDLATVFRFDGPHNEIHWHPRFSELFDIVKETCRYFAFLDADERLVFLEENTWISDNSLERKIADSTAEGIIPTTWLINTLNCWDTFDLLDTESRPRLRNNLRWGKPILPANLVGTHYGIHNTQFNQSVFSAEFGVNFFLLHYTQFPERRIAANRNKLISRGIVGKDVTSENIALMSFESQTDRSFMRFVDEIKEMLLVISSGRYEECRRTGDYLRLEQNGQIYYSSNHPRWVLSEFLRSGAPVVNLTFNSEPEEDRLEDASSIFAFSLKLRQQGEWGRAERLFRRGMAVYPDFLDRYGMPGFRKELMRMFLAQREWAKASELCPSPGDAGGPHWHYILFARAYSQRGDTETAAKWWELALEQDPKCWEAQQFKSDLVERGRKGVS